MSEEDPLPALPRTPGLHSAVLGAVKAGKRGPCLHPCWLSSSAPLMHAGRLTSRAVGGLKASKVKSECGSITERSDISETWMSDSWEAGSDFQKMAPSPHQEHVAVLKGQGSEQRLPLFPSLTINTLEESVTQGHRSSPLEIWGSESAILDLHTVRICHCPSVPACVRKFSCLGGSSMRQ